MSAPTRIGIAVVIAVYVATAGWLMLAHRPLPESVFVPLDNDEIHMPANAECSAELVTRDGHRGMICREQP